MTLQAVRENDARLSLLEKGTVPAEETGLYGLLRLAGDSEAQVVVEYLSDGDEDPQTWAAVSFYWGALPLASAYVHEFPTEKEARESIEQRYGW